MAAINPVPTRRAAALAAFSPLDYALYAAVVFLWGTSWIALHLQLGVVAPEVSLVWRFLLAAAVMIAFVCLTGRPLRFGLADHLRFAGLGLFLFSVNFVMFYYGGLSTPSGLLAVVFSLTAVVNMVLGVLVFGARPTTQVVAGALLGFAGVAAMFAPQILGTTFDHDALVGLGLCLVGTVSFCIGNILSGASQRAGVPVLSANAWGMAYGAVFLVLFSAARGQTFTVEMTLPYLGSLAWLAVFSSVFAFAAYLTLLGRIGADRAGFSTVMYPVVALAISSLFEGYVWTLPALTGLGLVLAGNLLVLTSRRKA